MQIKEVYKQLESHFKFIDKIEFRDVVSSTQTVAKQLFHLHEHNFLVVANTQTSGVGRFKRAWESPYKRGFYGSFVLREGVDISKLPSFNLFVSIALVNTFKYYTDDITLKWPNDIIIQGKKISGILTEVYTDDQDKAIILGIGINVNKPEKVLVETAISLEEVINSEVSMPLFLSRLFEALEKYYELYLNESFETIRHDYLKYSKMLGHRFKITTSNEQFYGKAIDIDEKGFLKVLDESGKIRTIISADIET